MAKTIIDNYKNSNLGLKGLPPTYPKRTKDSTLHNTTSLNGIPANGSIPSTLDLNGVTPPKYMDNPPK